MPKTPAYPATRATSQTALLLLLFCFVGSVIVVDSKTNEFNSYTDCSSCVAAGFGWSLPKGRCGGFSNVECPISTHPTDPDACDISVAEPPDVVAQTAVAEVARQTVHDPARPTTSKPLYGIPSTERPDPAQVAAMQAEFAHKATLLRASGANNLAWGPGPHDWGAWAFIRAHQEFAETESERSQSCSDRRIVAAQGKNSGIATVLQHHGFCMSQTWARAMTFVVDESSGRLGSSTAVSMEDFLLPISSCTNPKYWQNLSTTRHIRFRVDGTDECYADAQERMALLRSEVPNGFSPSSDEIKKLPPWKRANLPTAGPDIDKLLKAWWRGTYMHWMLRPNDQLTRSLEKYTRTIGYPSSPLVRRLSRSGADAGDVQNQDVVVAVHIRGGDKASETGWQVHLQQFGPLRYFEKAFELRDQAIAANEKLGFVRWLVPTVLFLATDDVDIVGAAEEVFAQLLRDSPNSAAVPFRLIYDKQVLRDYSMARLLAKLPNLAKASAQELLMDLILIGGADYIIGTCMSAVSTVAGQMYISRMMTSTESTDPLGAWHKPVRMDSESCRRSNEIFANGWELNDEQNI